MCASQKSVTARALSLSREEAQHARLRHARAPPRWLESVHTLRKPTAPARRPSPSAHGRAPTCQLLSSLGEVGSALAPLRSLSLGRRRSTSACDVCAPRRAGWSRLIPYDSPLRHRNGRLPWCTAVLRRSSPCPHLVMGCACSALTRHCARFLSGGCAARAFATCARPAALVGVGLYPIEAHCARGTAVSLGAQPCFDVRAPASNEQLTCACAHVKKAPPRALSPSLSREEAQHALATCARPAALVAVRHTLWKPTVPAGRPSPSAHGRAPTCQLLSSLGEAGYACSALARHCAHPLLGGGAARALATCALRAALVGVSPYSVKAHCATGTAVSLGARPCSDVPAIVFTW